MKTEDRLLLENAIKNAVGKICDKGEQDYFVYDDLAVDMTNAAIIVWDANRKGQEFAEDNRVSS